MPPESLRKQALVAALGLACALPVLSQQVQLPAPQFAAPNLGAQGVRALAMNCSICHGPDGRPAAGSALAPLAGRNADEIIEAMREFKQGQRPATVMHQVAKGYSDAEIEAMARYFAREKR